MGARTPNKGWVGIGRHGMVRCDLSYVDKPKPFLVFFQYRDKKNEQLAGRSNAFNELVNTLSGLTLGYRTVPPKYLTIDIQYFMSYFETGAIRLKPENLTTAVLTVKD